MPAAPPDAPLVLFVDGGFDHEPFAAPLAPALACVRVVPPGRARDVVALVTGAVPIGVAEVAPYPGLRAVVTCTIGTDHLDVAGLSGRGLAVCHTPSYCTQEVADHALACILAGWRGLVALDRGVRAGRWGYGIAGLLRRFDRSRLGIVGLGRIGRALAEQALALGIEVVACDPALAPRDLGGMPVPLVTLDELLTTSDAVSLHLPGSPGSPPLLGAAELARLKPDAVLVNLARPGLVDVDAMAAALSAGALGGAAWDVWPQEPPAPGDPRLDAPGLLVTPHAAWYSAEAERAYYAEAVDALRGVLLEDRRPVGQLA